MPALAWMEELGHQIRQARYKKGWSQEKLAETVGLSRSTINLYENGKGNPEFHFVAEIAAALEEPFTVLGCTIGPEDVLRLPPPAEQLCLEFDHDHRFIANLTIRPSRKSITITVDALPSDKLA